MTGVGEGSPLLLSRARQIGFALVLAHVAFRAWASLSSWFYLDDYKLLLDARTSSFDAAYVFSPYNSNLMPGGRVFAWIVAQSGPVDWLAASALILVVQALAALAAWWALFAVFGDRWGVLVPLVLYLTSAMTLPVMMWWTAGINQVPLQAAFFLALGCWINFLRRPRATMLVGTVLAVCVGLFFYVKAILILPVLAFIALAYFSTGGPLARVVAMIRRYSYAVAAAVIVGVAYVAYYVTHVTAPFTETTVGLAWRIAETMIGRAFATAVLGGPWTWDDQPAPNAFANPPGWATVLSWVVLGSVLAYAVATRRRTLRAVVLLVGYLAVCWALLVNSRGPGFGPIIGLEYRYLTDATYIAALVVGLMFMDVPGAVESSEPRTRPWVRLPSLGRSHLLPLILVCVIAMGGTMSSFRYVDIWLTQNASDSYLHTLAADLDRLGNVDLAEQEVPDAVYAQIFAPENRISRLTPLLDRPVTYPDASDLLAMVGDDGHLHRAEIGPGTRTVRGKVPDCGWRLRGGRPTNIPLQGRAFDFAWWMKIPYFSNASSPVQIHAGRSTVDTSLRAGLNDLYVRVDGTFDSIEISGLDRGVVACVDVIRVGTLELGDPL